MRAIGGRDVAHQIRNRAHAMHIDGGRIGGAGIALQENAELPLVANRLLSGGDRPLASNGDGQYMARKQDRVANRYHDEPIGGKRRQGWPCGRHRRARIVFGIR